MEVRLSLLVLCVRVYTLCDRFNDRLVEGRNIFRLAAEDELTVCDNSLVNPVATRVLDVGFE
jgi:hypothetical protein